MQATLEKRRQFSNAQYSKASWELFMKNPSSTWIDHTFCFWSLVQEAESETTFGIVFTDKASKYLDHDGAGIQSRFQFTSFLLHKNATCPGPDCLEFPAGTWPRTKS